jgi:hypothetical protein
VPSQRSWLGGTAAAQRYKDSDVFNLKLQSAARVADHPLTSRRGNNAGAAGSAASSTGSAALIGVRPTTARGSSRRVNARRGAGNDVLNAAASSKAQMLAAAAEAELRVLARNVARRKRELSEQGGAGVASAVHPHAHTHAHAHAHAHSVHSSHMIAAGSTTQRGSRAGRGASRDHNVEAAAATLHPHHTGRGARKDHNAETGVSASSLSASDAVRHTGRGARHDHNVESRRSASKKQRGRRHNKSSINNRSLFATGDENVAPEELDISGDWSIVDVVDVAADAAASPAVDAMPMPLHHTDEGYAAVDRLRTVAPAVAAAQLRAASSSGVAQGR